MFKCMRRKACQQERDLRRLKERLARLTRYYEFLLGEKLIPLTDAYDALDAIEKTLKLHEDFKDAYQRSSNLSPCDCPKDVWDSEDIEIITEFNSGREFPGSNDLRFEN